MAKEPGHRYGSAAEFGVDLRRYLAGEPVLARPEGRIPMIVRKCRRRPMLTGLAAALVLAILFGLTGVTWQWRRAEANLVHVQEQRRKAVRALTAGNRVLTELVQLANDRIVGEADRGSGALSTLLFEEYRGLVGALHDDPAFLPELVNASSRIACVLDDCAPREVWHAAWLETLAHADRLVRLNPTVVDYRMKLGECHYNLASNLHQHGRSAEGDDHLRRSRQIWWEAREIIRAQLEVGLSDRVRKRQLIQCELLLGQLGQFRGIASGAVADLRHALAIAQDLSREESADADLSRLLSEICAELAMLLRDDRPDEALALARSAVGQFEAMFQAEPPSYEHLHKWALAVVRLAVQEDHLNQSDTALRDFRRAADLYQRLLQGHPFNVEHRSGLATVSHQIGRILVETGRPSEAIEPYLQAIKLREALLSLTPENLQRRSDCAGTWHRLGEAQENVGRIAEAVEAYRRCLAHQRQVSARTPADAAHRRFLDERLRRTSWLLLFLGRSDEADELVRERTALRPDDPAVPLDVALQHVSAILVRHNDGNPLALIGPEGLHQILSALAAARLLAPSGRTEPPGRSALPQSNDRYPGVIPRAFGRMVNTALLPAKP